MPSLRNYIDVAKAEYIKGLQLKIYFTDSTFQIVDFKPFFDKNPQHKKFSVTSNFQKFKIDDGLLTWGKNWELVFPTYSLYRATTDNFNEDDGIVDVYVIE
ncbi:MAG: hypothetical protein ABI723_11765 [Bacteroidia bacterium]